MYNFFTLKSSNPHNTILLILSILTVFPRNAKLDAKIDSKQGTVVMGVETNSPYQQLIEKTKALSFRSQMLQMNIEKKKKAQDAPNWGAADF